MHHGFTRMGEVNDPVSNLALGSGGIGLKGATYSHIPILFISLIIDSPLADSPSCAGELAV